MRRRTALARVGLPAVFACLPVAHALSGTLDPPVKSVAIAYTDNPRYVAAAAVIKSVMRARGIVATTVELPRSSGTPEHESAMARLKTLEPAVIATGGVAATQRILSALPHVPVVFFMVPNAPDAPFLADESPQRGRVSGIASDVAPAMQVRWIRDVLPSHSRLAVLASERTVQTARRLQRAGAERGLFVTVLEAERSQFPATIGALNESDVDGVLMIPDAAVYNSATVQRLLLWGARNRKSVWAFSENIVRAGAIAGTWVDPDAVGGDAGAVVLKVLAGASPTEIGLAYSKGIRTAINERTARVIGVELVGRRLGLATERFGVN